ncbi:MAG TPA: carboxypeptidase regulatory-like domain-containing protein [Thermoanaerobaculia bacterium]|jgi:hypothetical protein
MLLTRVASVLGILLALAMPLGAAERPPFGFVQTVGGPGTAWAVVLPLAGGSRGQPPAAVAGGVPQYIALPADAPALICVGAEGCATTCGRADEEVEQFALTDGRLVRGICRIGRTPAAGARVHFRPANVESRRPISIPLARTSNGLTSSITTNTDGAFEAALAPGDYIVEVLFADGRSHESAPFLVPPQTDARPLELPPIVVEPGMTVATEVRSADGAPIASAGVGLSQRDGDTVVVSAEGRTDANGMIALGGLRHDLPLYLSCSASGFARREERLDAPPSTHLCVLERLGSIRGRVTDSAGVPLTTAVISLTSAGRRSDSAEDGTFVMRDVRPGAEELRITAPGYGVTSRSLSVEPGEQDLGTIVVRDGDAIRGRVVDAETQQAIEGASVAIDQPPGGSTGRTDDAGRFVVAGDLDQGTRLEVSAAGYATRFVTVARGLAAEEGLLVPLTRPGMLEVTVWDETTDAPCSGCTVIAFATDATASEMTDGSGIAHFASLAPGEYQVLREYVRAGARGVHVSGGSSSQFVSIRPRELTRVELGTRARRIRVAMTPQPSREWQLSAVGRGGVFTAERDDATGTFTVRARRGEAYRLQLSNSTRGVHAGAIAADYEGTLLTLPLGTATVRGQLLHDGAGVAGARVTVMAVDGTMSGWALTRPDGTFEVPYLRAGVYTLRAPSGVAGPPISIPADRTTDAGPLTLP